MASRLDSSMGSSERMPTSPDHGDDAASRGMSWEMPGVAVMMLLLLLALVWVFGEG